MTGFEDFGNKFGRKIDQNFTIFFPQKNEYKTRSETRFHQNRQYRANFSLTTARHEKTTVSESGTNSSHVLDLKKFFNSAQKQSNDKW